MAIPREVERAIASLEADDRAHHGDAYSTLAPAALRIGTWAPDAWHRLVPLLGSSDGRSRSIVGQALCRLAPHVPAVALVEDMHAILRLTEDEKFVTARHVLLASWQLGLPGGEPLRVYLRWARERWQAALVGKNGALIRHDLVITQARLYAEQGDPAVADTIRELLAAEQDPANLKKLSQVRKSIGA